MNNREERQTFLLEQPSYKFFLPPPVGSSKQIKVYTGRKELSDHAFLALQLANKAPLLMPCDFGIGVDQIFIEGENLIQRKQKMYPEDELLLKDDKR